MTTIAFDGKTLCVDSQITSGHLLFGAATKLWRLESGALLAMSGDAGLCHEVMLWLDKKGDKPSPGENESACGIMVEADGSTWECGSKPLRCFPACVPWAGGTGETIAMTAMRCGKTAQEAVELACEMDIYTSGPLQTVTVN